MAVDLKQMVATVLTFSMFLMLLNMIKRDHFDSLQNSFADISEQPKGFITFSLKGGSECHISQIADAVVVARYLGATLVLPDIVGSKPWEKRYLFGDIYDEEKLLHSLNGLIRVTRDQPAEVSTTKKLAIVRVPNRVSKDHIEAKIAPLFEKAGILRLTLYCPLTEMITKEERTRDFDSLTCLTRFGTTVELQPKLQELIDSLVERLRTSSWKMNGKFVAVKLSSDENFQKKGCHESGEDVVGRSRWCYGVEEVGEFLKKIGFERDTTIYLTQSRWSRSTRHALRDKFPNTYTKDDLIPEDKKAKFLNSENYWDSIVESVIDFQVCSQSDIFVPLMSGMFYYSVAGMRIASGRTQILVPSRVTASSFASDYISAYESEKNHLAYSCYCG